MRNETARREIESLDYYLQNHTNDYSEESHTAMMMAIKALEQEPKTGHWNIIGHNCVKCNQCGFERDYYNQSNYCPHCGAKMIKQKESEE